MTEALASIETAHMDMIHDAKLDYYGRKLATCSSDRSIKVFDVNPDGKHVQTATIPGHEGPVWQVEWAHPKFGSLLSSCGYDRRVIIHREYPANTWSPVWTFDKHESSVNGVSWAPHEYGLMLATASSDGKAMVLSHNDDNTWSASTVEAGGLGCNAVSWAPYGHLGSNAGDDEATMRLVTGGCDNVGRVFSRPSADAAAEWRLDATLEGHKDWVRDVAWAPNAGMPCNLIATASADKTVRLWQQDTAGEAWTAVAVLELGEPVWRVSWSLTGAVLAISSGESRVTLWRQTLDGRWEQLTSVTESGAPAGAPAGAPTPVAS